MEPYANRAEKENYANRTEKENYANRTEKENYASRTEKETYMYTGMEVLEVRWDRSEPTNYFCNVPEVKVVKIPTEPRLTDNDKSSSSIEMVSDEDASRYMLSQF